jgi:hypothetical protein
MFKTGLPAGHISSAWLACRAVHHMPKVVLLCVCVAADEQQALVGAAAVCFQLAMGDYPFSYSEAIAAVQTATGLPNSEPLQRCVRAAVDGLIGAAGALHYCWQVCCLHSLHNIGHSRAAHMACARRRGCTGWPR